VLAAYLAVLLLLGARVRCGRAVLAAAAAAGALLLGVCVLLLAARWPRSAVAVQRGGRGPSLVLIVLDGVRRDHVGLHGYQRATTPRLDALAHASRVYERAYSGSSWTAPSVDRLLNPVPGGPSLAARLSAAGYATACFTDNPHLGPGAELVRDFDLVRRSVGGWRRLLRGTLAGSVIERLLPGDDARLASVVQDFLASAPRPTFLYVHLMDAHAPFDAPPIDRKARPGRRILHPSASLHMDAEEAESVIARYDGGIREADRAAGRILSAVLRPQADVVVVVTADHGVRLGENGNWGHGGAPVPQVIGVPLLVAGQGVVTGRVQRAVGADSIPRTLLSAAGVPCVECSGTDLRWSEGDGVVAGAAPPNYRFVIADGYKLIADRRGPRRLYDLHADPLERSDLAAARPEVLDRLAAMLPPDRGVPDPSPDDLERLRALGYVR
jgi:arylsulfatase A-like enzyme